MACAGALAARGARQFCFMQRWQFSAYHHFGSQHGARAEGQRCSGLSDCNVFGASFLVRIQQQTNPMCACNRCVIPSLAADSMTAGSNSMHRRHGECHPLLWQRHQHASAPGGGAHRRHQTGTEHNAANLACSSQIHLPSPPQLSATAHHTRHA